MDEYHVTIVILVFEESMKLAILSVPPVKGFSAMKTKKISQTIPHFAKLVITEGDNTGNKYEYE